MKSIYRDHDTSSTIGLQTYHCVLFKIRPEFICPVLRFHFFFLLGWHTSDFQLCWAIWLFVLNSAWHGSLLLALTHTDTVIIQNEGKQIDIITVDVDREGSCEE